MTVVHLAAFAAPRLRGWPRLQAWLVDRIKRAALRQLHASRAGELLLLRVYLIGEEATEKTLQHELMPTAPAWLQRQVDQHLREEQEHSELFAAAMRERGMQPPAELRPDWLSRAKIGRWQRIARRHAPHFQQGVLVPAYAIGLCAEQMAERVLSRHCSVLPADHPLRRAKNLLLTPHVAGNMTLGYTCERNVQLFCENLENYAAGRPMHHLVDRRKGY